MRTYTSQELRSIKSAVRRARSKIFQPTYEGWEEVIINLVGMVQANQRVKPTSAIKARGKAKAR